jgi:hypothetical protein
MLRTTSFFSVLLLTATAGAWAGEPEAEANAGSSSAAQAQATPVPDVAMPAPTPMVPPPADQVAEVSAPAPSGPQPYTGWGRGQRAPIYVNMMMTAGAYGEDGSNRLTTRDSKILEGVGGVLRIGAVLDRHHRLGGRLQSFVRPTKKVLLDPSSTSTSTTTNDWGAVTFGFVGPEYIYTTDFGLYAGGSIGIGGAMSTKKLDEQGDDKKDHIERGSAGAAGILSLGYEWRANKWFAMNAEIYGGLYRGIDDNENGMNGGLFGMGMGVGF